LFEENKYPTDVLFAGEKELRYRDNEAVG